MWRNRHERLGVFLVVPDDVVAHFIDVQKARLAIGALMNVDGRFTHVVTKPSFVSRV
jgi:hypothetical protein